MSKHNMHVACLAKHLYATTSTVICKLGAAYRLFSTISRAQVLYADISKARATLAIFHSLGAQAPNLRRYLLCGKRILAN